jgi:DNA-directed RNA polymerase specialized sigma subunit
MTEDEQEELEVELLETATRHRELAEETAVALRTRDRLVVRVIDEARLPQGAAAELAGISRAQVHRILARAGYDDG